MQKIPGDLCLPLIGTAWSYLPLIGTKNIFHNYLNKYLKYGNIVRERIAGKDIVSVYDPEDFKVVFHNEGKWPTRISHEALLSVRRKFPELYNTGGLVPTNGEEWGKLRAAYQTDILRMQLVYQYLPVLQKTTLEFLSYLDDSKDDGGNLSDFLYKMHEWALENVCITVLDTRLDHFGPNRKRICRDLINGANSLLGAMSQTERSQFWRLFKTPAYRKVAKLDLFFYRFAEEMVSNKLVQIRKESSQLEKKEIDKPMESVLAKYLKNPANDVRDVITMLSDLIFTGLLTTGFSASFALYHLARNPQVQQRLYDEVNKILPTLDTPLLPNSFDGCDYLKACVKETLRLNPVAVGNARVLQKDVTLSGHLVKAGTVIITHNQVSSILPAFVDDPLTFKPERWLRDIPNNVRPHPYVALPFGTGARSCIGRRFAELEMYTLLSLGVKKFSLQYAGKGPVEAEPGLINIPTSPFLIKIENR